MSRRIITSLFSLLLGIIIIPIAWISYVEIGKILGLRPTTVEVAGTGSMYPSLFWDKAQGGIEDVGAEGIEEYRSSPKMYRYYPGLSLFNSIYFKTQLDHGDMVAFSSSKTRDILAKEGKDQKLGFIKRIIGKPGDIIELRDGFVLRNKELISEPYIRTPRSTYGGESFAECQQFTVPPNQYFVLGDNRKVSSDSRFDLGLVGESDIQYFLPMNKQLIYTSLWRDTSRDQSLIGTTTLKSDELYTQLASLKKNSKLENSARLRGQAILENKNTSFDMTKALQKVGYSNTVTGEFATYGHFTASELLENLQANYQTRSQLNNKEYSEIGIGIVTKEIDGCPTQVIVGHLGGYIPATYSAEIVSSWQSARESIEQVIPSWEQARGQVGVDQDKLSQLLDLVSTRQKLISDVITVMDNREWISDELRSRMDQDVDNADRAEGLARELNQSN